MKPHAGIIIRLLLSALLVLAWATATAEGDSKLTLSTGIEFTSGSYGSESDIEDLYVPVTAALEHGRLGLRLTVPYLSVSAPEGTVITGPGGEPIPGSGRVRTNSGLGDVVGSITLYDIVRSHRLGLALDLTGAVKLDTADAEKGLGTGETDFTVQADLLKFAGNFTVLGSLGYKWRGDPEPVNLEDSLLATFGGWYRFTEDTRGGLMFDYRESSIVDRDAIRELTGFVSRRVSADWRVQLYVLGGLSDSAPDWGAGVRVKREM